MTFDNVVWHIQFLVVFIAAFLSYRKNGIFVKQNLESQYLTLFCLLDFLTMCLMWIAVYAFDKPSLQPFVALLFAAVEITMIPIYLMALTGRKQRVLPLLVVYIVAAASSFFLLNKQPSLLYFITNSVITIYVFRYIRWLMKVKEVNDYPSKSQNLIVKGIAICYIGSIPYFVGSSISTRASDKIFFDTFERFEIRVFSILNIFMFVLFIKAFLCKNPSKS